MRRLLIVDDEPKMCECLKSYFSAKGLAVECAYTGEAALELVMDRGAPDIILLDIRLPDMLGTEVLKRLKDLCPETSVVMVTALDDPEPRIDAQAYGACGYITKPFDLSDCTWEPVFSRLG